MENVKQFLYHVVWLYAVLDIGVVAPIVAAAVVVLTLVVKFASTASVAVVHQSVRQSRFGIKIGTCVSQCRC